MRKSRNFFAVVFSILIITLLVWKLSLLALRRNHFDGQNAYRDVLAQVSFGPRLPNSQAHAETIAYIQDELHMAGWISEIQKTSWKGFNVLNIIASRNVQTPQIILGAHYDSRIKADRDQGFGRNEPVPGANDGASGVAVLLELARTLPIDTIPTWLVFFDSEDNGDLAGRDWIMGSRAFVAELSFHPRAVIIVDMVGDSDLNIYIEQNSNQNLVSAIWGQAARLGYEHEFIPTVKYSMLDDHIPFLEAGIPSVDIIDFDYPFWHSTSDTPDKISPKSLEIVGGTLQEWMIKQK